jgi:hypothetical protein
MEEKIQCYWIRQSLFSLWNYAQIFRKTFYLLFVHDDNKSNSGQIGQVVAMGGIEKTQDFFLWLKNIEQCQRNIRRY